VDLKPGWPATTGANGPPIIAGGLVWSVSYVGSQDGVTPGNLYGLDPATGKVSYQHAFTGVNHFATPSASGGRLFVPDADRVTAFTIASIPGPSATTTTLSSSANPAGVAADTTLTATVAPNPDRGTVAFASGVQPIAGCEAVAVGQPDGRATCVTRFATAGTYAITAVYSGDQYYSGSSGSLTQTVLSAVSLGTASGGAPGSGAGAPIFYAKLSPTRTTARHGTSLALTLTSAATVNVSIGRRATGRLVRGHCSRKASAGRRCKVTVTITTRRFKGKTGANSFRVSLKGLRPGRYVVTVRARASATESNTATLKLTIVAPAPARGR
jgi:hypothetical protein